MTTLRSIVFGAAAGYTVVAVAYGLLHGSAAIFLIPLSMIGGGYLGFRHVQNQRLRELLNAAQHATRSGAPDISPLSSQRAA